MTKKDRDSVSSDSNEELEALRKRVRELEQAADTAEQDDAGITKRGLVKAAWTAPVIMSVNLPNAVFAAPAMSPVSTPVPTTSPGGTSAPSMTGAPTNSPVSPLPTGAPTNAPVSPLPTGAPTDAPTTAPVAPTALPTRAPTNAPTFAPTNAPVAPTQEPTSAPTFPPPPP